MNTDDDDDHYRIDRILTVYLSEQFFYFSKYFCCCILKWRNEWMNPKISTLLLPSPPSSIWFCSNYHFTFVSSLPVSLKAFLQLIWFCFFIIWNAWIAVYLLLMAFVFPFTIWVTNNDFSICPMNEKQNEISEK